MGSSRNAETHSPSWTDGASAGQPKKTNGLCMWPTTGAESNYRVASPSEGWNVRAGLNIPAGTGALPLTLGLQALVAFLRLHSHLHLRNCPAKRARVCVCVCVESLRLTLCLLCLAADGLAEVRSAGQRRVRPSFWSTQERLKSSFSPASISAPFPLRAAPWKAFQNCFSNAFSKNSGCFPKQKQHSPPRLRWWEVCETATTALCHQRRTAWS